MLYIVGTGIWRWDDISVRGIELCKNASKVYLDSYTRRFEEGEIRKLESVIGKRILPLNRNELEEQLSFLEEAKNEDVVLLVPGDPLVATTHITILMSARKKGIEYKIVHASSAYTAIVGEAGLHIYKVGGSCTIPMKEKRIRPYSVYEKLYDNLKRGLHTVVFLDTSPQKELGLDEALGTMLEIEKELKKGVCTEDTKIVVGGRIGSDEQKLLYVSIKDALSLDIPSPIVLVFPGKLHFSEEDFLKMIEYKK